MHGWVKAWRAVGRGWFTVGTTTEKASARQRARQLAAERTRKLEDALADAFGALDAIEKIETSTQEKIDRLVQDADERKQAELDRQTRALRQLLKLGETRKSLANTLGISQREVKSVLDRDVVDRDDDETNESTTEIGESVVDGSGE